MCENPGAPVRLEIMFHDYLRHIDDLLHETLGAWNVRGITVLAGAIRVCDCETKE